MPPNSVSSVVIACSVAKASMSGAERRTIRRGKAAIEGFPGGDASVLIGGDPVEAGDIGPGDLLLDPGEKGLPGELPAEGDRSVEEIGEKGFAFADQEEIEEVGEGFGVQGDGDAAADDERIASRPAPPLRGESPPCRGS